MDIITFTGWLLRFLLNLTQIQSVHVAVEIFQKIPAL